MKLSNNNILFRPFIADDKSDGGIIVPESVRRVSSRGEVVSVGSSSRLKEGMIGYRVKDWGHEIIIGGVVHYIMADSAIIAVEDNGIYFDKKEQKKRLNSGHKVVEIIKKGNKILMK